MWKIKGRDERRRWGLSGVGTHGSAVSQRQSDNQTFRFHTRDIEMAAALRAGRAASPFKIKYHLTSSQNLLFFRKTLYYDPHISAQM